MKTSSEEIQEKMNEDVLKQIEAEGKPNAKFYAQFMSKCGFETLPTIEGGLKVWYLRKRPGCKGASHVTLTFRHDYDKLLLSYPHPFDCREMKQSFLFDVNDFLFAYTNSRKSNQLSDSQYFVKFEDIFFNSAYPKANKFIRFIFEAFQITPTIVHRCIRQNKNLKRKIDLEPKNCQYFAFLGLERKFIHHRAKKRENGAEKRVDVEKERVALSNMRSAIKNGAIRHDYNYFHQYLEAYIDYQRSHYNYHSIGKRKEEMLLDTFIKKVVQYQKDNNL